MKNYLNAQNCTEENLKKVATIMKNGGIAIFPTETVYGIGTNGLDEKAVKKLYQVKQRNLKNPINLLVSDFEMIQNIAKDISPIEYKLMQSFFPRSFYYYSKKEANCTKYCNSKF